jgi:hypothetical protein
MDSVQVPNRQCNGHGRLEVPHGQADPDCYFGGHLPCPGCENCDENWELKTVLRRHLDTPETNPPKP